MRKAEGIPIITDGLFTEAFKAQAEAICAYGQNEGAFLGNRDPEFCTISPQELAGSAPIGLYFH
jgi:hypothetical protein